MANEGKKIITLGTVIVVPLLPKAVKMAEAGNAVAQRFVRAWFRNFTPKSSLEGFYGVNDWHEFFLNLVF